MGYKKKASFTVEAALIMPVILGVIVLFIYYAMILHDRCAIEYVCRIAAEDAVNSGEESVEFIKRDISDRLDRVLILKWDTDITAGSDEDSTDVTVSAVQLLINRSYLYSITAKKHFLPKY